MSIISPHPESGLRLVIERPRGVTPPFRFEGHVYAPAGRREVVVTVDAAGEVTALADEPELSEKVRLLVRAACRHALSESRPPPLRIQRWRGEK